MNIIKVIVDEMPANCCRCPLMGKDDDWGSCLSGQELDSDYNVRRPDWCPLVTVDDPKVLTQADIDEMQRRIDSWNRTLEYMESEVE